MEFDSITGLFSLPTRAATGDFVLICCTGAYDMSMQYDFGDGFARDVQSLP